MARRASSAAALTLLVAGTAAGGALASRPVLHASSIVVGHGEPAPRASAASRAGGNGQDHGSAGDDDNGRGKGHEKDRGAPPAAAAPAPVAPVAPPIAVPRPPDRRCSGARRATGRSRLRSAEAALLCLINGRRVSRGLSPLRPSPQLRAAALGHSADMTRHAYFSHVGRNGGRLTDRVRATGYLGDHSLWLLGETLAWGGGPASRPVAIVSAFMHSPRHRRVILDPRFTDVGIALVIGEPRHHRPFGITLTIDYGARA